MTIDEEIEERCDECDKELDPDSEYEGPIVYCIECGELYSENKYDECPDCEEEE